MNSQERKDKVVSEVNQAVNNTVTDPTPQRLVLEIRKALSDYDQNWIYMD